MTVCRPPTACTDWRSPSVQVTSGCQCTCSRKISSS